MAVKEIGIPSGFSADVEALEQANYAGVKRIEEGDRKVILYFDEVRAVYLNDCNFISMYVHINL